MQVGHLRWQPLPDLPGQIGVAGPYVGVHNDALIIAGGANFPAKDGQSIWDAEKIWHDTIWVLTRSDVDYRWHGPFHLDRPRGYGAAVNTDTGVLCIGGNNAQQVFADVFILQWDPVAEKVRQLPMPPLPHPVVHSAATVIDGTVYLCAGQSGLDLSTATTDFYRFTPASVGDGAENPSQWERLPPLPAPSRAFNYVVAQHKGQDMCVYVFGGRRTIDDPLIEPLADVYEFNPAHFDPTAWNAGTGSYTGQGRFAAPWRRRTDIPTPLMAGTALGVGRSHVIVFTGADGSLFDKTDELRDDHPGFPKTAWAYDTVSNRWIKAGETPANQVTTPATMWGSSMIVAAGEVRPRVRTVAIWKIKRTRPDREYGMLNDSMLSRPYAPEVRNGVMAMVRTTPRIRTTQSE